MTIADRIKNRRIELNLTQDELAKKMGYSDKTSISKIENSGDDISLKKINKLAKILQCSQGDLLGWFDKDGEADKAYLSPTAIEMLEIAADNRIREALLNSLTDHELDIIDAYRDAPQDIKDGICSILHIKREVKI